MQLVARVRIRSSDVGWHAHVPTYVGIAWACVVWGTGSRERRVGHRPTNSDCGCPISSRSEGWGMNSRWVARSGAAGPWIRVNHAHGVSVVEPFQEWGTDKRGQLVEADHLMCVADLAYVRIGMVLELLVFRHGKGLLVSCTMSSMIQTFGLRSSRRFMMHLPHQCPKRNRLCPARHEYNSAAWELTLRVRRTVSPA